VCDTKTTLKTGHHTVLILALCQAAFVSTATLTATVGSLAGHALAQNKALATLPLTALVVGTAISTIPASLLMKRVGRRLGFIVGAGFALVGGVIGSVAVWAGSFWLLAAGSGLLGFSAGFAQLYRFAAAETAPPEFRSRAISYVLAGGLVAGFVGPLLATWTRELFPAVYLGSYLCIPLLAALSIILLASLQMPTVIKEGPTADGNVRSVATIVRQPAFIVAVVAQMMAQGMMNLLMTGTPLAMVAHHHRFPDTAFVIQWHVVGMFMPGFFTGALVQRLGERLVIFVGTALNSMAVGIGFTGVTVLHFWLVLILNGVGWNLMFVAGSTLVTKTYGAAERTRTQATNDFLVFGTAAVTSLASGQILHHHGWHIMLYAAVVMILPAFAAALWRTPAPTSAGSPR
jgi:MFS family permease